MVKSTMSPERGPPTTPPLARNSWTTLSLNVLRASASFWSFSVSISFIPPATLVPRNLFRWRQRPHRGEQPLGDHLGTRVEGSNPQDQVSCAHINVARQPVQTFVDGAAAHRLRRPGDTALTLVRLLPRSG